MICGLAAKSALVAGWSTKVGARTNPQTGQAQDIYYISAENVKFRSRKEVAQHFGLLEASVSLRIIGECPPEAVDKKLWPGAAEQVRAAIRGSAADALTWV